MAKRVTRGDVAARAGTSPAVVSYVLNDGPRPVAEATRARVLAAVEALGYRPNSIARSLRTSRTMMLGLIVPDTSNPFFGEASRAIEDAAFERGYMVVVGNAVESAQRQNFYIRAFADQRVDGVVILPQYGTLEWVGEIRAAGVPCVVLDRPDPAATFPAIGVENVAGVRLVVQHLVDTHGARRIACIAGPEDSGPMDERVEGWRQGLTEAGLEATGLLRRGGFHRDDVTALVDDLVRTEAPFDAIVAASDEHAFGVLRALYDQGLRAPDDVAVVGFDGVTVGRSMIPSLTTLARPFEALARLAVETLVGEEEAHVEPGLTRLPVTLRLGESCGCGAGPEAAS